MRIKYYFSGLSILLLASAVSTFAQSVAPVPDLVSALFYKVKHENSGKNILFVTDRNIYIAGEKIWFKAFVINANNGKPDLVTRNLFADIVNEQDSVLQQLVLDNAGVRTAGAFRLPLSIATGFYWIRCYTASQLTGDNSGIFLQPVYIVNKQLRDESLYLKKFENKLMEKNNSNHVIRFYGERLTAIPAVISTGVIEIRNGDNSPASVKGELVNSNDSVIINFETNNLGLARLTFVDDTAESYRVNVHLNSRTIAYQLPAVNKKAAQLSVGNQTTKTIKAFVTLEEDIPGTTSTTILAVQRDSLYFAAAGTGNYGITIPIDKFPGGIVRLLLFDGNKILISERKIFIPKHSVDVEIKPDRDSYSQRENVNLHVKVTVPDGKPLASVLNVVVQNEWIEKYSDSIESNTVPLPGELLLERWLNKYPGKYSNDDIDLLMVTRNSDARQFPAKNSDSKLPDYDDDTNLRNLVGKIMNRKEKGIGDRIVTVIAKNTGSFFMDIDTTDKNGAFSLAMPQGFDSLQLSLQVTDKHRIQTLSDSVEIDGFHFPALSTPLSVKQKVLADHFNTTYLIKKYHTDTGISFLGKGWVILPPVVVKTMKQKEVNYDASKRINSISQVLTSDKFRYGGKDAIGNAVMMVPGVNYTTGDITIFGANFDFRTGKAGAPLIIMDGFEVPSDAAGSVLGFLNTLNPADIDFIEVLRGGEAGQYGVSGGNGVISINTKHGSDKIDLSKNTLRIINPVTYHVCPQFEMPDYSNKEIKNNPAPDLRTTIYWNGNIVTNANGETDISFYTADDAANYIITITGLTEDGRQLYKRMTIENKGKRR